MSDAPLDFSAAVFLIGAQKSATTSFADMLGQHPDIVLSSPKEPDFFTGNWSRGTGWYAGCFARSHREQTLFDASTSYSIRPFPSAVRPCDPRVGVPRRIRALRPDARFIYLLRDPVARAHSAYWHAVRRGFERRPLTAAITPDSGYIAASSFAYQLDVYLEVFPPERFLIVKTSAFNERPQETMRACVAFLGAASPRFEFADVGARNRSFTYRPAGRAVRFAVGGEGGLKQVSRLSRCLLPRHLRDRAAAVLTKPVPRLSEAERDHIAGCLDPALVEIKARPGLRIVA